MTPKSIIFASFCPPGPPRKPPGAILDAFRTLRDLFGSSWEPLVVPLGCPKAIFVLREPILVSLGGIFDPAGAHFDFRGHIPTTNVVHTAAYYIRGSALSSIPLRGGLCAAH